MTWQRKHILVAGLTLIVASNAVALLGVWYNRNAEPESALRLSHRELAPPYWRGIDRESAGLELRLQWRALPKGDDEYNRHGQAEWLDQPKLEALGFDMSSPRELRPGNRRHNEPLSKQVFVAMELDGRAYQEALQRARRLADKSSTQPAPTSGFNAPAERLKREQETASRLFAIDAALDSGELRRRYPDRTRYAIVRGRVRVYAGHDTGAAAKPAQLIGYLTEIINDRISVPPEFRKQFDALPRISTSGEVNASAFEVTLAFGKRFEPWITAASSAKK